MSTNKRDAYPEPEVDENGNVVRILGVTQDITARHNLEEQFRQVQKMEALGQLAGGVAHDFNNLLTVINGYSDMLLAGAGDEAARHEALIAVRDAGTRAAGLTGQLLAFSRRAMLEPKVLDPNAVVADTAKLLRRLIGEHVVLTTTLDPTLRSVRVDPGQLGQVLMNLAVNARDAMPDGGSLTIETRNVVLDEDDVTYRAVAKPGLYVQILVIDSGTGIAPEVLDRIFEPFFTTKGDGLGTGLGLATTYGIVSQSGGHLGVETKLGSGTTFKVFLPASDAPIRELEEQPAIPNGGSEFILLVEDQEDVRRFATIALQSYGYEVLPAESGEVAMRLASRQEPDILITDLVMPGMSGREVAESLKARNPNLKVLYLSGYTDDAVVRHGLAEATDSFLHKPFTPVDLARKVREVLEKTNTK